MTNWGKRSRNWKECENWMKVYKVQNTKRNKNYMPYPIIPQQGSHSMLITMNLKLIYFRFPKTEAACLLPLQFLSSSVSFLPFFVWPFPRVYSLGSFVPNPITTRHTESREGGFQKALLNRQFHENGDRRRKKKLIVDRSTYCQHYFGLKPAHALSKSYTAP